MTEFLHRTLKELPYFRATLRSVEAAYYQNLKMDSPVLDIGCGDGQFSSLAFRQKLDVGIDPWRKPLKEALQVKSYHLLIQGEGDRLPFNDGFFRCAVSNSVLEHIADVENVLKDISRVLQVGSYFYFCVPNESYLSELSLSKILGKGYTRWFKKVTRVSHADDPSIWGERLHKAGFLLERKWNYFSPSSMRMLEWGHYFGLPSLFMKWMTGRWVLVPTDWNLMVTEAMVRNYASAEPCPGGVFTFYIARKK
jgi:SAM-dependent methyltransferase